jgi:hypothetical protein
MQRIGHTGFANPADMGMEITAINSLAFIAIVRGENYQSLQIVPAFTVRQ